LINRLLSLQNLIAVTIASDSHCLTAESRLNPTAIASLTDTLFINHKI